MHQRRARLEAHAPVQLRDLQPEARRVELEELDALVHQLDLLHREHGARRRARPDADAVDLDGAALEARSLARLHFLT
tara:strand:- start:418 stop:651 length:234 start_codon:yes stop_codon:yes gene_type:complete